MRLFVAVDLGDAIRAGIAEALPDLPPRAPHSRWVRLESMHLTLVFLGAVEDERVPGISNAIEAVGARHSPLELAATGGGAFGSKSKPRVLWLGIGGDVAALVALQADLSKALVPLGYEPEERAFSPHLTLARAGDPHGDPALAECAATLREVRTASARVSELILYRSDLSRAGARYTSIAAAPLIGIQP